MNSDEISLSHYSNILRPKFISLVFDFFESIIFHFFFDKSLSTNDEYCWLND